jgi:guanylate kinase
MQAPDEELRKRSHARLDESAEFERRLDDDKKEFEGIEKVADLIINTNTHDHESNLKAIESLLEE